MSNPIKGEVDFVVGDKTYTLKLGHNARAEAEQTLGMSWPEIVGQILDKNAIRHETPRALLWAGLHQLHPELSLFDVGDIIDEVGGEYVGEKLMAALVASAPKKVAALPPRKAKSSKAGTTG